MDGRAHGGQQTANEAEERMLEERPKEREVTEAKATREKVKAKDTKESAGGAGRWGINRANANRGGRGPTAWKETNGPKQRIP